MNNQYSSSTYNTTAEVIPLGKSPIPQMLPRQPTASVGVFMGGVSLDKSMSAKCLNVKIQLNI